MKTALRLMVTFLLLAVLAAGWFYLYVHSHTVSTDAQNATLGLLKDLKQLDSDWNADVLKSQSEINKSYDPLTRPLRRMADILRQLEAETGRRQDPALVAAAREIRSAIDEKSELVDDFKAQNSLLKNSLRYIPTAHQDIQGRMRAERDQGMAAGTRAMQAMPSALEDLEKSMAAADGQASKQEVNAAMGRLRQQMQAAKAAGAATRGASAVAKLEDRVNTLVSEALRYYSIPDQASADLLQAGIATLRTEAAGFPAAVSEPVENLIAHLEAILRLRTRQAALLQSIAAVPVPARIEKLAGQLAERFEAELAQQGRYNGMLLTYSAVALLLVFGAVGNLAYRNATERRRLTELVERQTRELKDNEVQLIHAQKMNALGEMVAGITHEVNTPLAAVKSGLQSTRDVMGSVGEYMQASEKLTEMLASPRPEAPEQNRERKLALRAQWKEVKRLGEDLASFQAMETVDQLLENGVKSVEHIHGVILNMLNFSRLDRSRIASVSIEEGVESTLSMAKHFLKRANLVKHLSPTPPVQCDLAQINQVLLNLLRNAAQALPESGGEITVETGMHNAETIRIVVRDNGGGIPPEVLPKIWQPFFTTKKDGAGTGLGLSTSKKIILAHGGSIDVESKPGAGTAFTILLPLVPPVEFYEAHGQERQPEPLEAAIAA